MTRKREDTRLIAPIAIFLEAGDQTKGCFTRNISLGGLFVVTSIRAPVGATVKVSLTHQKKRLSTTAEVVSVVKDGMGLRFIAKTPEFTAGITDLINSLLNAKGANVAARQAGKKVQAGAAWAYPLGDQDTETWQKSICAVGLLGLSLDGAALEGDQRPPVGETILFFITTSDAPDKAHHCHAQVARHLERGFAIKFVSPSIELRQAITSLRRGALPAD